MAPEGTRASLGAVAAGHSGGPRAICCPSVALLPNNQGTSALFFFSPCTPAMIQVLLVLNSRKASARKCHTQNCLLNVHSCVRV